MLIFLLLLPLLGAAEGLSLLPGELKREAVPLKESYPDNPFIPGVSSTTGLPFEGEYVPIMIVIDNAPNAHPHWGVKQADVVYQVPNAGAGATKLMALFADHAPSQAGGVRSARMPFVDVAYQWGAGFAFAHYPTLKNQPWMDIAGRIKEFGMRQAGLSFDLAANRAPAERVKWNISPHNLSAHIDEMKEQILSKGLTFEPRGFRFADALPEAGVPVSYIHLEHRGILRSNRVNPASASSFDYDASANAYYRSNSSGPYLDKDWPHGPIPFANVIVQRTPFSYVDGGYVALKELAGSGAADIFTGGRYIAGAWSRAALDQRTVFVDDRGEEIALQRGATFIIITNDVTEISYR